MATYHFSPTGNDSTGTGSQEEPWLTLNTSLPALVAGDSVLIDSDNGTFTWDKKVFIGVNNITIGKYGTAAQASIDSSAFSDNAIEINARATGVLIENLSGTGPNNYDMVFASGSWTGSTVTIDNCYCTLYENTFSSSATTSGTLTVTNVEAYRCYEDGISPHGGWTTTVNDSTFEECGYDSSGNRHSTTGTSAGDGVSAHDTSTIAATDCVFINNAKGITHVNDSGTNVVNRCLVYHTNKSSGTYSDGLSMINQNDGGSTDVFNTIVIVDGDIAVNTFRVNSNGATGPSSTMRVYNCTVISRITTSNAFNFRTTDTNDTLEVFNTISVMENNQRHVFFQSTTTPTYAGDENVYYDVSGSNNVRWYDGTSNHTTITAWRTATSDEANSVEDNPDLGNITTSFAVEDMRPVTGSPCIDNGLDQSLVIGASVDYENRTRPSGSAWDIGALEFRRAGGFFRSAGGFF